MQKNKQESREKKEKTFSMLNFIMPRNKIIYLKLQ